MLPPILCAASFRPLEAKLVDLLASLAPADWQQPTIAGARGGRVWLVQEVAAHMLDTALRKLAMVRDGHFGPGPQAGESLAAFVNRLNAEGVRHYQRLSPALVLDLLQLVGPRLAGLHEGLDPFAPALFAVSWAGQQSSANWFDTARELTERWHHQEQIRLATGAESLVAGPEYPFVLDCFFRALPHTYRAVEAPAGTRILFCCGAQIWCLVRNEAWELVRPDPAGDVGDKADAAAKIMVPPAIAWRIFTKGIAPTEAQAQCTLSGDEDLLLPFFSSLAIVA